MKRIHLHKAGAFPPSVGKAVGFVCGRTPRRHLDCKDSGPHVSGWWLGIGFWFFVIYFWLTKPVLSDLDFEEVSMHTGT